MRNFDEWDDETIHDKLPHMNPKDQARGKAVLEKRIRQRSKDSDSSRMRLESRKEAREEQRHRMLIISTAIAAITIIISIIKLYPDIKAFFSSKSNFTINSNDDQNQGISN